ncbi:MAG: serine/threonine protein kinase [Acidobacteriota bacterium]|nr:serine/threonine protein kinase [Acidobacteriota bacterium]
MICSRFQIEGDNIGPKDAAEAFLELIGRYEAYEQIGMGSMGVVYRAWDTLLDRFVALKVLRAGPEFDTELRERFNREAKFGARLQHANIATVYDLGEVNKIPYIAMELLNGCDIRKYVEEKRPLTLSEKLELIAQVCEGLAHAHLQGIVHRDIKPSNIFVHENRVAKVLDFGIARLPTSTLTQDGNVLGTPNYMSPEQIFSKPCDTRSDLFSASIVFYEFLTYAHPFRSVFIPRRIAEDNPDSLYDRIPDVPHSLEELIHRGLEKRPEDRIQSAHEFGMEIRRILDLIRPASLPRARAAAVGRGYAETIDYTPPIFPPTPCDDDSRGRRVSEFMNLAKVFDAAIAVDDLEAARRSLSKMRAVGSDDALLRSSLIEYQEQFAKAENHQANHQRDPRPAGASQPVSSISQTSPPAGSFLSGATERLRPLFESLVQKTLEMPRVYRRVLAGAGCLLVLFLIAIAVYPTPVPVQPYIAKAVTQGSRTDILEKEDASSKRLGSLSGGTRVDVLNRIKSPRQQWIAVQYISPDGKKNGKPGFVQLSHLSGWSTNDPQAAWDFLSISQPSDKSGDQEIRSFLNRLDVLTSRFPASLPVAAGLDGARLNLILAQRSRTSGGDLAARQEPLDRAKEFLDHLPSGLDSTQVMERDKLMGEREALSMAEKPKVVDYTEEFKQISRLWEVGEYKQALTETGKVLEGDPKNPTAQDWRKKIENSIKEESKYQ